VDDIGSFHGYERMKMEKALVAICTFNPKFALLERVIESILLNVDDLRILIIDSASTNGVPKQIATKFDLDYLLIVLPGTAQARLQALVELKEDELLVFVDDDNILEPGYVDRALQISKREPGWGAFAGKLKLPSDYPCGLSKEQYLPYLAIKDLGPESLSSMATLNWSYLEPPAAGACIRPEVAKFLVRKVLSGDNGFLSVGAIGKRQLRGEDSFLMRQCFYLNLEWGYDPSLQLEHRFDVNRLKLRYVWKLLYNMGYSDVFLHRGLNVSPEYPYPKSKSEIFVRSVYLLKKSKYSLLLSARFIGQYRAAKHTKSSIS
jgi:glycosyltransferase involved in cell wall biosynthesis